MTDIHPLTTTVRVVMSGPLPPAIGGMASVIGALSQSTLAQQTALALFDTGKKTQEGRSLWTGVQARLRLMREWRNLLRQHRADIAHIHTCSGLTFFLDGLLAWQASRKGCSVVLHVHGARFDQFLDGLHPVLLGTARLIARQANTVIALSADWQQRLASRLPGAHIQVLANGVPEPAGSVAQLTYDPPPRFLFLGNLCKRKGVPVLLDAMEQALSPWLVQFAGGDEDPGFTEWTRMEIQRRGLQPRAQLLGPVVGLDKDHLLLQADAFVLPSLAEGLPMSMLEAMAAKLSVVVTTVGAMPEVIENGVDGLLVPPNDAAALAAALDRLAKSPEARKAMGQAAYLKYRSRYSVDAMATGLLQIYKENLTNTSASSASLPDCY